MSCPEPSMTAATEALLKSVGAIKGKRKAMRGPQDNVLSATTPTWMPPATQRKLNISCSCLARIKKQTWWPVATHWAALLLITTAVWGIVYSTIAGSFYPGSQLFSLLTLFVLAYLIGQLGTLCRMPALVGMLLTGIALRNLGVVYLTGEYSHVSAVLRQIALTVIFIRAGLGLDSTALKSLTLAIARLVVVPTVVEGSVTAICSHYWLGLPWLWGALAGAITVALSPAIVMPCLANLQNNGFLIDSGLHTFIVATSSIDNIMAICLFGVFIRLIFVTGSTSMAGINGILAITIGVVFGLIWGVLCAHAPHHDHGYVVALRSLMIGCGGVLSLLGSEKLGFKGAGPLGCMVAAFLAGVEWRKQGWTEKNNAVEKVYEIAWTVVQPILFGLIGAEVDVSLLGGSVVGYGLLSLFVAQVARIFVTIVFAYGAGYSWKEKILIAVTWFPKAAVQAALGPVALEMARAGGTPDDIIYAGHVLVVAVLAILLTAPAGAIILTALGPILLPKRPDVPSNSTPQDS